MTAGSIQGDALLAEVEMRRALAMLAHEEQWKRSLQESHRDTDSREALLTDFKAKARLMKQAAEALGWNDLQQVQQRAARLTLGISAWF